MFVIINIFLLKSTISSYTLDKFRLGETGYLSKLYYLLAAQASGIHFKITLSKNRFSKIVFSKNINFIALIDSSSESSESSKSSE